MIELYSIRDVSRILALQESRLRYWTQTGFVGPTVRKGGRFYYTFGDLVAVKAAKDLLEAGVSLQKVRKNLDGLKKTLPDDANPAARLRVCSDGETIVALADDVVFQPMTGQVVMAFNLPSLGERVAEVLCLPLPQRVEPGAPNAVEDDPTEAHTGTTAYRFFVDACAAEDAGDEAGAEHLFRQALDLEPNLAAALTNLGNLLYRRGDHPEARKLYERALDHDPNQPEARYNLANVLEDQGELELAIAELRRVCADAPTFADAHYNLGIMLAQVGGTTQAKQHLERYLELDGGSAWAGHARGYLAQLAA
jgi:tetratricopeptide (TPR) repeat protein